MNAGYAPVIFYSASNWLCQLREESLAYAQPSTSRHGLYFFISQRLAVHSLVKHIHSRPGWACSNRCGSRCVKKPYALVGRHRECVVPRQGHKYNRPGKGYRYTSMLFPSINALLVFSCNRERRRSDLLKNKVPVALYWSKALLMSQLKMWIERG